MAYVYFESAQENPDLQSVSDIAPEELWQKRGQVAIVDVRRPDEYVGELSHIQGSQHMVLDTLPERVHELPKDKTIVFVCRSGARSARATQFALDSGFESVYNMKGGMLLWRAAGLEVAAVDEET